MTQSPSRTKVRFSLLTLLLLTLLAGSGGTLWAHRAAWTIEYTLRGNRDRINSAFYTADGRYIVTLCADITMRVWRVADLPSNRLQTYFVPGVAHAAASPDSRSLALCKTNGLIELLDLDSGKTVTTLKRHNSFVSTAVFSRDGAKLFSAGGDQVIREWDCATGQPLRVLRGHTAPVWHLAISDSGKHLASVAHDNSLRCWDLESGKVEAHGGEFGAIGFSPNSEQLVSANPGGSVRNLPYGGISLVPATFICWSQTHRASANGKVLCIETEKDGVVHQIDAHTQPIFKAAFSPDGARVATASKDKTIGIWDVQTGAPIAQLTGPNKELWSVSFAHDGTHVLAAGADKFVNVWMKRRPEAWWGLAWLPEFWLSTIFSCALVWQCVRGLVSLLSPRAAARRKPSSAAPVSA